MLRHPGFDAEVNEASHEKRPAGTALHAKFMVPSRENSSRFLHFVCSSQSQMATRNSSSLSSGRRISCRGTYNSMPRNVIIDAGPTAFFGVRGEWDPNDVK